MEQFISMNRDINDGKDLPVEMLRVSQYLYACLVYICLVCVVRVCVCVFCVCECVCTFCDGQSL